MKFVSHKFTKQQIFTNRHFGICYNHPVIVTGGSENEQRVTECRSRQLSAFSSNGRHRQHAHVAAPRAAAPLLSIKSRLILENRLYSFNVLLL